MNPSDPHGSDFQPQNPGADPGFANRPPMPGAFDPYAGPSQFPGPAYVQDGQQLAFPQSGGELERPLLELATVGQRLAAKVLNGVMILIVWAIGMAFGYLVPELDLVPLPPEFPSVFHQFWNLPLAVGIVVAWFAILALYVGQLALMAQRGQTIGKILLRIRVQRTDGGPIGIGGAMLREFVPMILAGLPFVGSAFFLADILFIYRDDRRTIADHIANTVVVKLPPE